MWQCGVWTYFVWACLSMLCSFVLIKWFPTLYNVYILFCAYIYPTVPVDWALFVLRTWQHTLHLHTLCTTYSHMHMYIALHHVHNVYIQKISYGEDQTSMFVVSERKERKRRDRGERPLPLCITPSGGYKQCSASDFHHCPAPVTEKEREEGSCFSAWNIDWTYVHNNVASV